MDEETQQHEARKAANTQSVDNLSRKKTENEQTISITHREQSGDIILLSIRTCYIECMPQEYQSHQLPKTYQQNQNDNKHEER